MPYAPRATLDNPYGPQITFRTEDVLPPSAYYVSPEDQVTVWVVTDVLAQTISLQLRLLMPTGIVQLIPYQFSPTSTYTWGPVFEVPPWEGYLLGAMCWSSNPLRGQTFVSVQVMRSAPPNLQRAGVVLLQGYISELSVLSYPTSPIEGTFSGRGAFLTITLPNQTGSNIIFGAPANTLWKLCSLVFNLITSAAAGNRVINMVEHDVNGVQTGAWPYPNAQAPLTNFLYCFSPGASSSVQAPYITIGAPDELFVPGLTSIGTYVAGLDASDTFTNVAARFEEWMGV